MALQKNNFLISKAELHSAVLNPEGSKCYLKKIIPASLAFILYQRIDFDKKNFQTQICDKQEFKVFHPKLQNSSLEQARDWVNGALEALEKNYLRELYLILCSVNEPQVVLESYKFQFKYMGDDVIDFDFTSTEKELKSSTASLLEAINALSEFTKHKENEIDIKMAITHYDEVTPEDYIPQFYKKYEEEDSQIEQSLAKHSSDYLLMGLLKTRHHIVKCKGKGDIFHIDQSVASTSFNNQTTGNSVLEIEYNEPDAVVKEIELQNTNQDLQSGSKIEGQDTQAINQEVDIFDRRFTQTPTISEISMVESLISYHELRCFCNISCSFEHIGQITCPRCHSIYHCVCLGYLDQDDVPKPFLCTSCTDKKEYSPLNENKNKLKSIYRLTIAVAYFTESLPEEVLKQLPSDYENWLLKKMKQYKIIIKHNNEDVINMELLRKSYIKEIFTDSFSYKRKSISDENVQEMVIKEKKKPKRD